MFWCVRNFFHSLADYLSLFSTNCTVYARLLLFSMIKANTEGE